MSHPTEQPHHLWMKIDRPGAAIIGAVLMVAFRIVGACEALASVDVATVVRASASRGDVVGVAE